MLLPTLAKKIISEVKKLIDEDLIVVDINGFIIASTKEERIHSFHEGALLCCRKGTKIIITEKDQLRLKGVKAGINLPVFFQQQIIGVIGITVDPDKVSAYGEIIRKMTELLIKENYYSEQIGWQARVLEALVFDWIQLREYTEAFRNQAVGLGIDITIPRQVIIGQYYRNDNDLTHRNLWQDILQTFLIDKKDVFVRWGNQQFVFLYAVEGKEKKQRTLHFLEQLKRYLNTRYQLEISFGIGQVVPPQKVYQSFEQAVRALSVAKRQKAIVFEDELQLEMCLQDIKLETRIEFVHRTIGTIVDEEELLSTLKTFLTQNQSFKKTANTLHIHINTLHYRLKRIQQLTKLNPRLFHDMTTLYLALIFLDDYLKNQK